MQGDAPGALDGRVHRLDVVDRFAVENHAGDEENEDDDVEVEIKSLRGKMVVQVDEAHQTEDHVDRVAVVDSLRKCWILRLFHVRKVAGRIREFGFRDRLDLVLFGVDQGHEDRERDDENQKGDQIEGLEDALGDRHYGSRHFFNEVLGML